MTSLFGDIQVDGVETQNDSLGGRKLFDSAVVDAVVQYAWAGAWDSGARFVEVCYKVGDNEFVDRQIITNAKGESFYVDKKDATKKVFLPGYKLLNDIALIVAGKPLNTLIGEERKLKLWDFTVKDNVVKAVPCLVELHDKPIKLALLKQQVNKTQKNPTTGKYDPVPGTSEEENSLEFVGHPVDGKTVQEALKQVAEPSFLKEWDSKWNGKVKDARKLKGPASATGGQSGRPTPSATATSAPSLFS